LKSPALNDLKKEMQLLPQKKLAELCLALAKYKKDNKEYLSYLLFDSENPADYAAEVKHEIDQHFAQISPSQNLYYTKKNLRRLLRLLNKYCRYINDKGTSAELHIYFVRKLVDSGIPYHNSKLLENLYFQELRKIKSFISAVHEDLQADYTRDLAELEG
jgi:hypothetical protein